jgi:hypothetical protein
VWLDIAWWDLAATGRGPDDLTAGLRPEDVAAWASVPGLSLKVWIADPVGSRWGAAMLWHPERPGSHLLPPNRGAELAGGPPTERGRWRVVAAVTGPAGLPATPSPGPARQPRMNRSWR